MTTKLITSLTICTACALLAACAAPMDHYDAPLVLPDKCLRTEPMLIEFTPTLKETQQECGANALGCTIGGTVIVAPRPKDWNDTRAMAVIGHQVMHALCGATHETK